jgi:hypothetical protein
MTVSAGWGWRLNGLAARLANAYPSAVLVPKEILADVLHAVPLAASITILAESMCCWGFSSFYNIPSAWSSSALWMRPEWRELRHAAWAYRNARDDYYTRAANRMCVTWEAVLLLRSGCDAGDLVSAVLELAT